MVLLLASCRSSKKATTDSDQATKPTTTVTTKPSSKKKDQQAPTVSKQDIAPGTNFTAKIRATITQGDQNISTTGTLRMRYDDVIQITLVDPILGVAEIGRLELSSDSVLVIDRINKRYVSTSYENFAELKNRNIDFPAIQDLFWQEAQNSDHFSYTIPAKKSVTLDLKLSNKGNSSNWSTRSSVSNKYTKTDANTLFGKMIGQ